MALINMGTADGSTIGNPSAGNYYLFIDSNNSDLLTKRDSAGNDRVFSTGESIDELGWVAVTDTTYTSGTPFTVATGVTAELDFNNDTIIDTYAPNGYSVSDYFDDSSNRILTTAIGNAYMFRLTFKCVPANNSRVIDISYSIGPSIATQIVIDSREVSLRTSGTATNVSLSSLIYSLGTFDTNGMHILLTPTTDVQIYDTSMVISRIN